MSAADQVHMPAVRHIADLADAEARQHFVNIAGPIHEDLRKRGFSMPARSHKESTIAEKSLPPKPRDRAVLKASRAAAATGIGTLTAFAASMMSVRSLCAR